MKPFFSLSNSEGMTLIEAMVAILILSIGLIPVFTVILLASNFSTTLKNNLIAANLAQEGVEIARALRDENWLASDCFGSACGADSLIGTWIVQSNSNWGSTNRPQPVGTNPPLNIDANGLYNYGSGAMTGFKRK